MPFRPLLPWVLLRYFLWEVFFLNGSFARCPSKCNFLSWCLCPCLSLRSCSSCSHAPAMCRKLALTRALISAGLVAPSGPLASRPFGRCCRAVIQATEIANGGANVSCYFWGRRGKRTIERALQNWFWIAQKVGLVWSVPVLSKENDRA